jgi:catechol 2,3-dioxygenase-like lactoylglutathione lyase family enzyme
LPAVRALALTVSDLDTSRALFEALDFRLVSERYSRGAAFEALVDIEGAEARSARLALGAEIIELTEFVAERGRPIAAGARSNDAIFQHMAIVVADMDRAYDRVRRLPGVHLTSPAPQTIPLENPAAGGIRALYFEDSDGHDLELIWFPAGKGRARWQAPRAALFLGIDHSAIAVSSSEASEPLYGSLGFEVAGRSLNEGSVQSALSGVAGARVAITGFSAEGGPGVEFLSYLAPGPGRAAPPDSRPSDLWHWEVQLEVGSVEAARRAVLAHGGRAGEVVDVRALELGYSTAALVQDRDGHTLRLLER